MSDQLADSGFLVIVPDIYEGTDLDAQGGFSTPAGIAWLKQQSGEKCRAYVEKGIALATSRGSTSVGLTGYCWGVW